MAALAQKLGAGSPETLRKRVRQIEIDEGPPLGLSSADRAKIKRLKREHAVPANEILSAAAALLASNREVIVPGCGARRSAEPTGPSGTERVPSCTVGRPTEVNIANFT